MSLSITGFLVAALWNVISSAHQWNIASSSTNNFTQLIGELNEPLHRLWPKPKVIQEWADEVEIELS